MRAMFALYVVAIVAGLAAAVGRRVRLGMRTFLRGYGLAIFFGTIFVGTLAAQSLAGQRLVSAEEREHGGSSVSWWDYVTSPDFWGAVMENWQSEFLQFTLFIGATVWLVQKGSNESKKLDDVGLEWDESSRRCGAPREGRLAAIRPRRTASCGVCTRTRSSWRWGSSSSPPGWHSRSTTGERSTRSNVPTATPRCRGAATCSTRTSGRRRSRTGSPSSLPSV